MPEIVRFNVVKGFLNLVISDRYYLKYLNMVKDTEYHGFVPGGSRNGTIMVEYSSPNTNKPLAPGTYPE